MVQSYKIFIKDVPLLITSSAYDKRFEGYKLIRGPGEFNLLSIIQEALNSPGHGGFFFNTAAPTDVIETIKAELQMVVSAGGIVWNRNNELLMIYRRGKWDLPKGKVENQESVETAAIREVEEESGVGKLRIIQKTHITYHIYRENRELILKLTHWFEMFSTDMGETIPQESEGITKVKWVPVKELKGKTAKTYSSMKDLIEKVLKSGYISQQEV